MRNRFLIAALLLAVACRTHQAPADCKGLREIVVDDKFSKTEGTRKKTVFDERKTLYNFCEQIGNLQPMTTEPVVKANFGYYELTLLYDDGTKESVDIIYTKYDGVVVRYRGKFHKNNELDSVMRGYLAPPEWRD